MRNDQNYWEKGSAQPQGVRLEGLRLTPINPDTAREQAIKAALTDIAGQPRMSPDQAIPQQQQTLPQAPSFWDRVVDSPLGGFLRSIGTETPYSGDPNYPTNQYEGAPEPAPTYQGGFGDSLGKATGSVSDTIGGIAQGIIGAFNRSAAQANNPESIWARIAGQSPYQGYSGPSAQGMAQQEFAPQFQVLDQIAKQQAANYQKGNTDLGSMYDSLANNTYAGADKIKQSYAGAADQVNTNGAAAAQRVNDAVQGSNSALLNEMARLGLNEGAPALMDKSQSNLANQLGLLSGETQNSANMMDALGANTYAYGRERGDINKQAGVERQADLLNRYNQAQADNANTRLGLTGQQQAAANKYGMDIASMNQQGQQNWYSSIKDQVDSILGYNQHQTENQLRQAGLELDKSKFKASQPGSTPNAYEILQQKANELYGGDQASVDTLSKEILDAWRRNPQGTAGQLMSELNQDTLAANPQLAMLAFDFFNRVGAKS